MMRRAFSRYVLRDVRFLLALALVCALLAPSAAAAGRYAEKEHLPVDFADMERGAFDETALADALEELEHLGGSAALRQEREDTRERLETLYQTVLKELNTLSTRVTLADIDYNAGGAGEAASEAVVALNEQYSRLFDRAWSALSPLAGSPYRDILEADAGKGLVEALSEYEGNSTREAELLQEEDRLEQEYDRAMAVPVELDGKAWTWDELESADLSDEEYWELRDRLELAQNEAVGEIYRKLVKVRTEIAQENGYDDYAEYAYELIYGRDYSEKDLEKLLETVKKRLVPLWTEINSSVSSEAIAALERRCRLGDEDILDALQPCMEDMAPELGESFRFLREHHLYDIEARPEKLPVGFTSTLPAYGTAFVFNCPYGSCQDYSDMVHEFGHFNEAFYSAGHELWVSTDIDVAEIQSQGLELLFTRYAEDIFPGYGDTYTTLIVSNILDSVLDGCMYDEFQAAVYREPEMSLDEINRLYLEISQEYGYYYEPGTKEAYGWCQVSHNFNSPMYFVSYATSALTALELWLESLEDWDDAVETYLDVTALPQGISYRRAVKMAGLGDIFRRGAVREIADDLEDAFQRNWQGGKKSEDRGSLVLVYGVPLAAGLGIVTAARRAKEKKAASRWRVG